MAEVEDMVAAVGVAEQAQGHSAALEAESAHMEVEDMAHTGEGEEHWDTAEVLVAGSRCFHMVACSCCTSGEGIADAGCDIAGIGYEASSCLRPVACLALPADDGCSSCRLGKEMLLPTRPRSGGIGDARAAWVEP